MINEPLIVLNALVIRADSSPPTPDRAARPGYNVNRAGQGIEEAGTGDRQPAFSPAPQLEWEAFDEYWRKTHGPKILHVDGAADTQTGLLSYYLQQHRIPAGPCSEHAPPYRVAIDADGLLERDPLQNLRPYARPNWDGLAQLAFSTRGALEQFFDLGGGKYAEKIVPDEAVFIRGFGFHLAEEHVVVQHGDRRRDPIIALKLHTRLPELSRPAFRGRWMAQHAALLRELAPPDGLLRRYVQLVNISEPGHKLYDAVGDRYDGIGVYAFANMNDCEDFFAGTAQATLAADELQFAARTEYFTALNYVICDSTSGWQTGEHLR